MTTCAHLTIWEPQNQWENSRMSEPVASPSQSWQSWRSQWQWAGEDPTCIQTSLISLIYMICWFFLQTTSNNVVFFTQSLRWAPLVSSRLCRARHNRAAAADAVSGRRTGLKLDQSFLKFQKWKQKATRLQVEAKRMEQFTTRCYQDCRQHKNSVPGMWRTKDSFTVAKLFT